MTKQDKKDWDELCNYVKLHILRYGDDFKFPKYLALRLNGLSNGNFITNKHIKSDGNYSYKCILATFKLCKNKIINYMDNNQVKIKDENHKINLVMSIVEQEINDVKIRMNNSIKQMDKVQGLDLAVQKNESADYINKNANINKKDKISDRLKDLW